MPKKEKDGDSWTIPLQRYVSKITAWRRRGCLCLIQIDSNDAENVGLSKE